MKKFYLSLILVFGMFAQQGWAPPPGKGGATGGAEAAPDISRCDLNPSQQTKVHVRGQDGKDYFICTGSAICGGAVVPVSCKVSEKEPCPTANQCIQFDSEKMLGEIRCSKIKETETITANVQVDYSNGAKCSEMSPNKFILLKYSGSISPIYIRTKVQILNSNSEGWKPWRDTCFKLEKGIGLNVWCNKVYGEGPQFRVKVLWATDKIH